MLALPENIFNRIDPDLNYLNDIFDSNEYFRQSCYIQVDEGDLLISNKNFLSAIAYNIRSFNANSDAFFQCSSTIIVIPIFFVFLKRGSGRDLWRR